MNMSIAPACNQWKLLPVNVLTSAALSMEVSSASTKPAVKIFGKGKNFANSGGAKGGAGKPWINK